MFARHLKDRWLAVLSILSSLLFVTPASALYCGNTLVREGMRQYQVASICGQPVWTDSRTIYVSSPVAFPIFGPAHGGPRYAPQEILTPVVVDEWTYDFGPTKLMQLLIFRDGVLIGARALGYGN